MTKEEAIKYLQQLYPNGGHCWLDEQRIEAISMAIDALQEEPVSEELEKVSDKYSEDIESNYSNDMFDRGDIMKAFEAGANWQKEKDSTVSEDFEKIVEEIAEPTILNAYGTKELARRLRNTICGTSVSEDLEKASKEWLSPQLDKSYAAYGETKQMELTHFDGYAMLNAIEFGAQWQKTKDESTPEDLGEYINELSKQFPEVSFAKLSRIAVRVAKWQKEQFEKNRLAHCDAQTEEEAEIELDFVMSIIEKEHRQPTFDDAIKYGMNLQKEQMMAKAKCGTVQKDYQIIMDDGTYIDLDPSMSLKPSLAVKEGERIKVIVINED